MEQLQQQNLQLLARKGLLLEELKTIDSKLAQLAAIAQFVQENASQPEAAPEPQPETEE